MILSSVVLGLVARHWMSLLRKSLPREEEVVLELGLFDDGVGVGR